MKEDYTSERRQGLFIWISVFAILLLGVGIFFYYTFLRQSHAELIETIPVDAAFVFEINNNNSFAETITPLTPYFNEMFSMDLLPAYETIYHKLPRNKEYALTISGHLMENGTRLLFNTHLEKSDFKKLLRALSIDPANYTKFEQYKIYTFGTNYKSLKFAFFNHVLVLSDDINLVKKALIQFSHPKSLISNEEFKKLYTLSNKNTKQNWLLLHVHSYSNSIKQCFTDKFLQKLQQNNTYAQWTAFQIRAYKNELFLSGYMTPKEANATKSQRLNNYLELPDKMLPSNANNIQHSQRGTYALCQFSLPDDSSVCHNYLVLVQDTLQHPIVPLGDPEKNLALRNQYPNGIYPITDSTFSYNLAETLSTYHFFIERDGNFLLATSEEALATYTKNLNLQGALSNNRNYQLSKNNVASTNIEELHYYPAKDKLLHSTLLSQHGQNSQTFQHLQVLSISYTEAPPYMAVNLYFNFDKKTR